MDKHDIIAIFDLDYTLTKKGTWGRFVWMSVRRKPLLWLPLLLCTLSFQLQYKLGKVPRGDVKRTMMRWSLMRLNKQELEQMAEKFADNEVSHGLRPGGLAALAYHNAQGHRILIASAAVDLIVSPIARRLDIEDFVSTNLAWCDEGGLLDCFASPNCYGEAKLECVKKWCEDNIEGDKTIYFYSDSKADLPVLEFSDIPVVIDPSSKFLKIAAAKQMTVQNWMESKLGFTPIDTH